jgi:alpha-glucosidase
MRARWGAWLAWLVACTGATSPPASREPRPPAGAPACGVPEALPAFVTREAPAELTARCAGVTLRVSALADGVVRLRTGAPGELAPPPPRPWSAVLPGATAPAAPVSAGADGDAALLCAPELAVRVAPDCTVRVTDRAGRVLVDDAAPPAPTRVRRRAPAGARYYGFGERTGRLDRRGRRLTFWNTDAYDPALGGWRADQDPLYQSIPFYLAVDAGVAHGVFTDDTHRLEIDVAAADPGAVEVVSHGDAVDQYVIAGPALREVLRRYTALTGRTPLPPRWALGFHQSRWGYASAAEVEGVAGELRARDLPADGLWLDIQHMDRFRTFTWDPVAFTDPEGLLARLAAQGFHVTVIADPGLAVDPTWPIYADALAGRHFLETPAGAPFLGMAWPGASSWPDFTRAETRAWWGEHVAGLAARGVAGVWLDVNEPTTFPEGGGGTTIPDEVIARGDATRPATMAEVHNVYANLEARATWEALAAAAPERRPFVLSRAGYAGIQRWAAVWTGDAPSRWESLAQQLPMLLGMGLSGVPLVGSDVGGYSGGASPELYARWLAVGAVSPFFRAHVTSGVPGQEPWRFGPEALDIARAHLHERYRRLPYLYSLLAEAAATGLPPLRPMILEFQDDDRFLDVDDQAMLGPFLLVAPVVEPGVLTREVVLPAGRWFEARSGAVVEGPVTITVDVTLAALPMFVRAGAILPAGPVAPHTGAIPASGPLELEIYPGDAPSGWELHEDAGDGPVGATAFARTRLRLEPLPDGARLLAARVGAWSPPPRTVLVRVRRVDHPPVAVLLDGAPIEFVWDEDDLALVVGFDDRPAFELRLVYDRSLTAPAPPVRVPITVTVPPGTPLDTPITIATSASGWTHQPLTRTDATTATGSILVPRGAWYFYKYARGDWSTVEKYLDCGEAHDRYRFGAAGAVHDTVATWRDACD